MLISPDPPPFILPSDSTYLSRVGPLSPHDPARGLVEVAVGEHERGRFATQLQRKWTVLLNRRVGYNPSNLACAGEEDVVERELE